MILSVICGFVSPIKGQTHFRFRSNTDQNATVGVPATSNPRIDGAPLAVGDEIGAFTPGGLCVGAMVWNAVGDAMTVWGDDSQTEEIDGIRPGELIVYRMWRRASNTEIAVVEVSYSSGNGVFAPNALSIVSSLNGIEPPGAPVPASPPDNATGVPVSPTLVWHRAVRAEEYRVQVSRDAGFGVLELDRQGLTDTAFAMTNLEYISTYYWRISAGNAGGVSDWSVVSRFTTEQIQPPPVPRHVSPPDGATDQDLSPTLVWHSAARTSRYHVQLSTTSQFSSIAFQDSLLADTLWQPAPLMDNVTFYWRVRAGNTGGWSAYSASWNFTTRSMNAPLAVTEVPMNITATSATLLGTVDARGLTTEVKFGYGTTPALGNSVVAEESPLSANGPVSVRNTLRGLRPHTTYFYAVAAFSSAGTTMGDTLQFTTDHALSAPTLVLPSDNAVNQPVAPMFSWRTVNGASAYRIEVATDTGFSSLAAESSGITDTLWQSSALARNTTYYWRVQGSNTSETGPWSSRRMFRTVPPPPEAPLLYSPSNGVTEQPLNPRLAWRRSVGSEVYRIQLSSSSTFTTLVTDSSNIVDSVFTAGPLANNTTYYWRVRGRNTGGESEWSTAWRFTTSVPIPTTPTALSPQNNAQDVPNPVLISWSAVPHAENYTLQVGQDQIFSSLDVHDSTLTATSTQVRLAAATRFFWRVRARNGAGVSSWTAPRSFRTEGPTITQSIPLNRGWNMVSGRARPMEPQLDSLCKTMRDQMVLVKNPDGEVYWPEFEINTIGDWNHQHGYQIYMVAGDTLELSGNELVPPATPYQLRTGWNLAGYPRRTPLRADSALGGIAATLVIAKDNDGKVYWPEFGINTIGSLKPGEGYQMYLTGASTLVYPDNESAPSPGTVATTPVKTVEGRTYFTYAANTGNNATIGIPSTARPEIQGVPLAPGDEIGAFTPSGLCVGAVVWNGSNAALTVWGDDDQTSVIDGLLPGEEISYRVWQKATTVEYTKTTVTYSRGDGIYSPNGIFVLASLTAEQPTKVSSREQLPADFLLRQNWPNPFNPATEIEYSLPRESHVRLEVFTIIGQRAAILVDKHQAPGYYRVSFEAGSLPGGIYFYRLEAEAFTSVRKMTLLR